MKTRFFQGKQGNKTPLADLVVGLALSSVLLGMTGALCLFASRDLAATARYTELTSITRKPVGAVVRGLHSTVQGPTVTRCPSSQRLAASGTTIVVASAQNP